MRPPEAVGAGRADEAGPFRPLEQVEEVVGRLVDGRSKQVEVPLGPDDRRQTEDTFGVGTEPHHAAADDLTDAVGQADLVDARRPRAVVCARGGPALGQVLHDLPREERVAVRLPVQRLDERQPRLAEVVAGGRNHELGQLGVVESRQGQPVDAGLAPQRGQHVRQRAVGADLGVAVGPDDEKPRCLGRGQHVPHEEDGGLVRPVQVIEHDEDRRVLGRRAENGGDGRVEQVPLGLGVARDRRGHAGDTLGHGRHHAGQVGQAPFPDPVEELSVTVADEVTEHLQPGPVRQPEFLVAAAVQHHRAGLVRLGRHFGRQAGLADAGLAGEERGAAVSCGRLLPPPLECIPLTRPADERDGAGDSQPARERHGRGAHRAPDHLEHRDRGGEPLQRVLPARRHLVRSPASGEHPDHVGRQDLATLGERAQTCGLDHGVPEIVVVLDGDLAGAYPHPDREGDVDGSATVVTRDRLLHGDRTGQRGRRAGEHDHEAVAQVLDLRAPVGVHRRPQKREVGLPQHIGIARRHAGRQLRRTDQIGEDNRHRVGDRHLARPPHRVHGQIRRWSPPIAAP